MKKFYTLALTALIATPTTWAATPLMRELSETSNQVSSLLRPKMQKASPAKAEAETETTWGEWQPAGTGTFTLDEGLNTFLGLEGWTGSFEGIKVYNRISQENESKQQYKFEGIFNGADITVDYDANTHLCKVMPQPTNIDAFGMLLNVADPATVFELYGEAWLGLTPEEAEAIASQYSGYTYFVPELGKFYLYLGYLTDGIQDMVALTDCTFQLDGVGDMTVTVGAEAFYKDADSMTASLDFTSSVAECKYGCFEGILNQAKIDAVVNNAEGVESIKEAGQVKLSAADGPGMYTIVAVTFAANGTPLEWDYAEYTYTPSSSEGWTSLGKGTFKTDTFESLFDLDIPAYEVEVEMNNENNSIYRVVNPYGEACPYPELSLKAEGFDIYLVFDATNPEKVFFKPTNLGIDTAGGWWIASNYGYFSEAIQGKEAPAESFGTLADGKISFPSRSVLVTCEEISIFGGEDGNWYYGNGSGTLSLTLPQQSGIEAVATDNGQPEYINMQGLKVASPAIGSMVIERKGSTVVKKVIR